jgi:selenocysteine-specific elongation factor
MARVRLLGTDELKPDGEAFIQLMLQEPIVALRQDRFIIRRPSPPSTIAGGLVLDPHPTSRHKRFNNKRLKELEQLLMGTPEDILLQAVQKTGPETRDQIIKASGLEIETAAQALEALMDEDKLVDLNGKGLILSRTWAEDRKKALKASLTEFHKAYPLRLGMPREQLKSKSGVNSNIFNAFIEQLEEKEVLKDGGTEIHLTDHHVSFSEAQQSRIDELLNQFKAQAFTPPTKKQCLDAVGEVLLTAIFETGQLVQLNEDVLLTPEVFREMKAAVVAHIQENEKITLAELRDKFKTSRKYAVAVLDYLDQTGVTIRQGDFRILRRSK